MEDAFGSLRIDAEDDEPPVFRSCAVGAFEAWDAFAPAAGGPHPDLDASDEAPKMRCGPADLHSWDWPHVSSSTLGGTPPRLEVNLVPHRSEGQELLVCSLRLFTVSVALVEGTTGTTIPDWSSCSISTLRATLVYADNGATVPSLHGEAPLAGELIDGSRPRDGVNSYKLRVTALSYHHNRRTFAIRIDADPAPGSTHPGCFACSPPIRSVARLPNAEHKSVPMTTTSLPVASALAPAPAEPTVMVMPASAGAMNTPGPASGSQPPSSAYGDSTPTQPVRICPPMVAVVAEEPEGEDYDARYDSHSCGALAIASLRNA